MAVINDLGRVLNIIICQDKEPETPTLITYFDENPACIGGDYVDGYFYSPQPFTSWTRDGKGKWVAPIPEPDGVGWF